MSRFSDLVSKPARDMASYFPAPPQSNAPTEPQPTLIKLDSNENPFGPSPRAIEAMQSAPAAAHYYPDDDSIELRRKLAAFHSVPTEQVLVTAGSTEMLALLCQTILAPGLNAVTSERSFIIYTMAVRATGAQLIQTPMCKDADDFDLDAILAAINQHTRLVFLANPNNPTGTILEGAAVDQFLAKVPNMWWSFSTRRTTTSRCTSPPCGRLITHVRSNTCGAEPAWWCCELFQKHMDWPGCA